MAEAEALCDRVTFIDRGRLLATESPAALSERLCRFERVECEGASAAVLAGLGDLPGVSRMATVDAITRIEVGTQAAVADVMRHLVDAGVTSMPTLEQVYLGMVGDRGLEV
jgi:ABC-2 type transport system ATP-binding protein